MNTTVNTEKHVIIGTGSVVMSLDSIITITIDNEFDIVLVLLDDKEKPEQRVSGERTHRGVKLTLINFDNAIGVATSEPIDIAMKKDKKICLALAVYSIGTVRLLHYNVLMEK
jgi:hypothetical protein